MNCRVGDRGLDVRDHREGTVMVLPWQWERNAFGFYWLRHDDGREWPVPTQFLLPVDQPAQISRE